jgi:hypothetical protein
MKAMIFKKAVSLLRLTPAIAVLFLHGCDDYVSVPPPSSQLTSETVFSDKATATAAMMDVYAKLRESSIVTGKASGLSAMMGLYADELDFYGDPLGNGVSYYNNNVLGSDAQVASWWANSYNQVYAVNAIIEGLQRSDMIQQSDKDLLVGEALFIRAFLHFYLVNLYGSIPYITTTDYAVNAKVSRMPDKEAYDMMIADLQAAYELLPEQYPSAGRTRVNKPAASALLARVCLFSGDYAQAADAASAVLNNTALYADEALADMFLKGSRSTIWQFSPLGTGNNSYEGQSFIFASGPPPFAALSDTLLDSFEAGDQRRLQWIAAVGGDGGPWYHSFKYKEKFTDSSLEYSIVMRLAEMYLIRSEARLQQGELLDALEDLNHIRSTAGLTDFTAGSAPEILAAIVHERRVEFFTEHGHRFFDLKRLGLLDQALSGRKPGWQATDALLPIPESDLKLNPNLAPQNPGY